LESKTKLLYTPDLFAPDHRLTHTIFVQKPYSGGRGNSLIGQTHLSESCFRSYSYLMDT